MNARRRGGGACVAGDVPARLRERGASERLRHGGGLAVQRLPGRGRLHSQGRERRIYMSMKTNMYRLRYV